MPERLYTIIDVETTGGTTYNSRITEISIFLWDGEQVIDEFTSLINPQMTIPDFITDLTGIDNEMVQTAPSFDEVAQRILEITEGATFVAHNVNFDYGMVSHEFQLLGYAFNRPKLCTVRLARKFLPGHRSYSLGQICSDIGIPIHGRHRARGDAEATTTLFAKIYELSGGELNQLDEKWVQSLPEGLSKELIHRLPETAGVYYFFNEAKQVIYVGSSRNVYKKVVSQIQSTSKKAVALKDQIADIDFEPTGSELIAKLKASSEISRHLPAFNTLSNRKSKWSISSNLDIFGYLNLIKVPVQQVMNPALTFGTQKEADAYLLKLCKKFQLCERLCGLKNTPTCAEKRCMKACQQIEPSQSYNVRVEKALNEHSFAHEHFVILDRTAPGEQCFVMVENHKYVGYGMVTNEYESVSSVEDFRNYLCADEVTLEKIAIIQTFLVSNKPKMIVA